MTTITANIYLHDNYIDENRYNLEYNGIFVSQIDVARDTPLVAIAQSIKNYLDQLPFDQKFYSSINCKISCKNSETSYVTMEVAIPGDLDKTNYKIMKRFTINTLIRNAKLKYSDPIEIRIDLYRANYGLMQYL